MSILRNKGRGIFGVICIFMLLLLGACGSESNQEVIEYVKNSSCGIYTNITLQEVLENNWENGKWDSFEVNEGQIVEYVVGDERNTLIQYIVDLENDVLVMCYMKINESEVSENDAHIILDNMCKDYLQIKYPVNDIDFVNYMGKEIEQLLKDSKAFSEVEGLDTYMDYSEKNIVSVCEGKIESIIIQGEENYAPMFAKVKIGDCIDAITELVKEKTGYEYIVESSIDNYVVYGDRKSGDGVCFIFDDERNVISIHWMSDYLDMLEDVGEENQEVIEDDFEYIYGGILDATLSQYANAGEYYFEYAFYDVDKDNYSECIILHGTCVADMIYEIYTIKDGNAIYVGITTGGGESIYQCVDGNGMYKHFANGGYEVLTYLYMKDGCLLEEVLYEGMSEEYGNFDELQIPIEMTIVY